MPNILHSGLRWERSKAGGTNGNPPMGLGRVATGYDGDLGGADIHLMVGMAVRMENTGTFSIAATGATIFGVVVGILPYYASADGYMKFGNYLPNQTAYGTNYSRESQLIIIPVENQIFKINCDDATSATTYAAYRTLIGNNGDHIMASAPSPTMLLDISDVVATAANTAQWRVEDVCDQDLQDFASNYVELLVSCNEMQRNSTTGV